MACVLSNETLQDGGYSLEILNTPQNYVVSYKALWNWNNCTSLSNQLWNSEVEIYKNLKVWC